MLGEVAHADQGADAHAAAGGLLDLVDGQPGDVEQEARRQTSSFMRSTRVVPPASRAAPGVARSVASVAATSVARA